MVRARYHLVSNSMLDSSEISLLASVIMCWVICRLLITFANSLDRNIFFKTIILKKKYTPTNYPACKELKSLHHLCLHSNYKKILFFVSLANRINKSDNYFTSLAPTKDEATALFYLLADLPIQLPGRDYANPLKNKPRLRRFHWRRLSHVVWILADSTAFNVSANSI